jgi:hydrogenase expression/formation protein HypC
MCLAVPGKIVECRDDEAVVDFQGNRLTISTVLIPQAVAGDWVLVHAGFAISTIDEEEALETWDYLRRTVEDAPGAAGEAGQPIDDPGTAS